MAGRFKSLSGVKKVLVIIGDSLLLLMVIGALSPQQPQTQTTSNKTQTQTEPKTKSQQKVKGAETKKPVVTTKTVTETASIPYQLTTQNDPSLPSGQTSVTPGMNGEKTITYKVTYTDGKETGREKISDQVTKQPVDQVTKVGTKVAEAPAPQPVSCTNGYINSDGNCIPSPSANPVGATARCNDGTYSYSAHRSGTCSHHGGVAEWL